MTSGAITFDVRKILLTALLIAVAAAFTAPASAFAAKSCTYYSDGTYSQAVGGYSEGCCGGFTSWGQFTPYRRCQTLLCPDVVCPEVASAGQPDAEQASATPEGASTAETAWLDVFQSEATSAAKPICMIGCVDDDNCRRDSDCTARAGGRCNLICPNNGCCAYP